jgi:hypothetical protein
MTVQVILAVGGAIIATGARAVAATAACIIFIVDLFN